MGWFGHAIFKDGKYPQVRTVTRRSSLYLQVMRSKIDSKSSEQGFPASRLPTFTEEEQQMVKGSRWEEWRLGNDEMAEE